MGHSIEKVWEPLLTASGGCWGPQNRRKDMGGMCVERKLP